ncbi:galactokinase [Thalassotalea mangrovi]|uniref:Galactokinase n=1 Tax=Thalassotalea mangrovi TaxID=2572245 RepID=A0A4U1B1L3_9GAMM|nr:galactokinase [Thalassotalea mangrovi]TKB43022.1 galactokinase [Thalassotalea mangrovi]
MNLTEQAKQYFTTQFGSHSELVCYAPGRVNIIGDHTDYNDGFVLPAAINYGTAIAASPRDDRKIIVYAHDCDQQTSEFNLENIEFDDQHMWSNYVRGTLSMLLKKFPDLRGATLAVTGNVPQGAGLSSSASFEIAILKTFKELFSLPLDGIEAALLGQQAENQFVGCNCGIMDQLISAMGQESNAMLLDCRALTFEDAPIPEGYCFVIVNSNVKRGLVDSEYNLRREQCEAVAKYFNVKALRDLSMEQLLEEKAQLSDVEFRRARHVISENDRTLAALEALKSNDIKTMSELMRASHLSLKQDFEVTTPEMDALVDIIHSVLGDNGGCRMTGGGFGGCVIALAPKHLVDSIKDTVAQQYPSRSNLSADIYVCSPEQGAFR